MNAQKTGNAPNIPIESNGGVPVNLQDQTSKPIVVSFNKITNSTTLKNAATENTKTVDLISATGAVAGAYIIIFDPISGNFSFYTQIGAAVGTVITLDTPLDYSYPAGSYVSICTIDMTVNGSSTTQVFGLRGTSASESVDLSVDITGINFYCLAGSAVDLSLFADQTALTNGLVLRKRNETYQNLVNIKNNGQIAALEPSSFQITEATNPAQGQDGFYGGANFAGQHNLGVAIRLAPGEDLEFLVQDNLSSITYLAASASGHVVQD